MDTNQFWQITQSTLNTTNDSNSKHQALVETLSLMEVMDISHWYQIANLYRICSFKEKLWGAARILCYGYSDGVFDYFLGWLVAQGKEVFLSALKEPDSLADVEAIKEYAKTMKMGRGYSNLGEHLHFETIVDAAIEAYQKKTESNKDLLELKEYALPNTTILAIKSEIKYAKDIDAVWYTHEKGVFGLENLLPRLYKLFGSYV